MEPTLLSMLFGMSFGSAGAIITFTISFFSFLFFLTSKILEARKTKQELENTGGDKSSIDALRADIIELKSHAVTKEHVEKVEDELRNHIVSVSRDRKKDIERLEDKVTKLYDTIMNWMVK